MGAKLLVQRASWMLINRGAVSFGNVLLCAIFCGRSITRSSPIDSRCACASRAMRSAPDCSGAVLLTAALSVTLLVAQDHRLTRNRGALYE
jgi:hypothetical protein